MQVAPQDSDAILVIEDDPPLAVLMTMWLADAGWKVAWSPTVDGGIRLARHYRFVLALLDVEPFGPSEGASFAHNLGVVQKRDTPVILVSDSPRVWAESRRLGMPSLAKPIDVSRLVAAVTEALTHTDSAGSEQPELATEVGAASRTASSDLTT